MLCVTSQAGPKQSVRPSKVKAPDWTGHWTGLPLPLPPLECHPPALSLRVVVRTTSTTFKAWKKHTRHITMRWSFVTNGLGSFRSAGHKTPSTAIFQAPWTAAKTISRPSFQSIARTGATLVDTPTATHDQPQVVENSAKQADAAKILKDAVSATGPRQNWTREEISAIYYQPLLELAHQAVSQLGTTAPPLQDDAWIDGTENRPTVQV